MSRAVVSGDNSENVREYLARLAEEFAPILAAAREAQSSLLGLSPAVFTSNPGPTDRLSYARRSHLEAAEMFNVEGVLYVVSARSHDSYGRPQVLEDGTFVVKETTKRTTVNVCAIGDTREPSALSDFEKIAADVFGVELERWFYKSERFDSLLEEGRVPVQLPSEEDRLGAYTLMDSEVRKLAIAMKSASGLLQSDAAKVLGDVKAKDSKALIKKLVDSDLATTGAVVICKKTGVQSVRVPDATVVADLDKQGIRCSCGKPISSEPCEEVMEVTDLGRSLLDGSRWYTVVLVQELVELGVPVGSILTEEVEGGDEMDCIAAISGDTVLFELKDKVFSLNNAYSFGAKIGLIRPDASVVVTTEHVAGDVKDHFERAASRARGRFEDETDGSVPAYIEGVGDLRAGLEELISRVTRADAVRVLSEALTFGSLSALDLVNAWSGPTPRTADLT